MNSGILDNILDFAHKIDDVLWGPWTMIFLAFVAVFMTWRSGLFQFRKFRMILGNTYLRSLKKIRLKIKAG